MLIYLDLCCVNRPWDDQSSARVRLETEAKLEIQERVRTGKDQLVWSYALAYENSLNPFRDRRESIVLWQPLANTSVQATSEIVQWAEQFAAAGLTAFDAFHVACAKSAGAKIFVTTDDRLRRVAQRENMIETLLPQEALAKLEDWYEN